MVNWGGNSGSVYSGKFYSCCYRCLYKYCFCGCFAVAFVVVVDVLTDTAVIAYNIVCNTYLICICNM